MYLTVSTFILDCQYVSRSAFFGKVVFTRIKHSLKVHTIQTRMSCCVKAQDAHRPYCILAVACPALGGQGWGGAGGCPVLVGEDEAGVEGMGWGQGIGTGAEWGYPVLVLPGGDRVGVW